MKRIMHFIIWGLLYAFSLLPNRFLDFLSHVVYFIGFRMLQYRHHVIIQNLSKSVKDKDYKDITNMALKNMRFMSQLPFDWLNGSCKALHKLFKQLKQNFPLKYFLGDNENAIEIQICATMLANLLITLLKSKVKRSWAFSNMVSIIRQKLMNYINIYAFLEIPEKSWLDIIKHDKNKYQNSLFPVI